MANQQEPDRSQTPGQTEGGGRERGIERREGTSAPVRRGQQSAAPGPFSLMRKFSEDMDRFFGDFFGPSFFRWGESPEGLTRSEEGTFWPQIEVHQEGDKLVVQADVPGVRRDDINVEVHEHDLRISGERRSEAERSERGYYSSERTYGAFTRVIPLPEGVKPDTASASFENGVLRIEMEAPNGTTGQGTGRRIEVREGSPH